MTDARFTIALKLNPDDQSSRVTWGGESADQLIARANANRRTGEIVLLVDHRTGAREVVAVDGSRRVL